MRLGLFGGTFDPVHLGHLVLAEQCREALELDAVWFVVAGSPPHKPGARTPAEHRLEMVRLAIAGHAGFSVSEIETRRPGPHYSIETLRAVRVERPDDELFFLIGADSLTDLPSWREPEALARLASVVVVNRPGMDASETAPAPDLGPDALPLVRVSIPPIGIASHDLRRRLREGQSVRYLVPRAVQAYLEHHGLYRDPKLARPPAPCP